MHSLPARCLPRYGANQGALAEKISEALKPSFTEYGLTLDSFVVENLSLPDELQKVLDQRISMNVLGDMGKFTHTRWRRPFPLPPVMKAEARWEWAQVSRGRGHGPGHDGRREEVDFGTRWRSGSRGGGPILSRLDTKFCSECGKPIARSAKFCPECGKPQV